MKTRFVSLFVILIAFACNKSDSLSPQTDLVSTCEYDTRKTVSTLTNQQGTVRLTVNGTETWVDIMMDGEPNTPLCACNLPASYSEQGFRIQFSADVKEIYPNEKWRCQPVKLTALTPLSTPNK